MFWRVIQTAYRGGGRADRVAEVTGKGGSLTGRFYVNRNIVMDSSFAIFAGPYELLCKALLQPQFPHHLQATLYRRVILKHFVCDELHILFL